MGKRPPRAFQTIKARHSTERLFFRGKMVRGNHTPYNGVEMNPHKRASVLSMSIPFPAYMTGCGNVVVSQFEIQRGDRSTRDRPVVAVAASITDWSGPYVGVTAGSSSGVQTDYFVGDGAPRESDYDMEGSMYGAFAGYNIQRGSLVFGGEAAYLAGGVYDIDEENYYFSDFVDLKARVGFAGGSMGAWEDGGAGHYSVTGFNYGAGVDLLVTDRFFAGAEYIVREFSDDLVDQPNWTFSASVQTIQVRAGMKF